MMIQPIQPKSDAQFTSLRRKRSRAVAAALSMLAVLWVTAIPADAQVDNTRAALTAAVRDASNPSTNRRAIRRSTFLWPELHALVNLSRTRVTQLRAENRFPAPITVKPIHGRRSVAWRRNEVTAWLRQRKPAHGRMVAN